MPRPPQVDSTPSEPAPAATDYTTLGAAMRAIRQAIQMIGEPEDECMRAVRRVLRGAVIIVEDSGDETPAPAAPQPPAAEHAASKPGEAYTALREALIFAQTAMQDFREKVHTGRAKSEDSYNKFTLAWEKARDALAGSTPAQAAPQREVPVVQDTDDSLMLCASDMEHSAIFDKDAEMQECLRAVANRVRSFAKAPQPSGPLDAWQQIETAPKDGTAILLWERYSDNPFVGFYSYGSWSASHEHVDAEGGWDGANVVDKISQELVTHWQPLPPAPSAEGVNRGAQ